MAKSAATGERAKNAETGAGTKKVVVPSNMTVRKLAEILNISAIDVIKELMNNGIMASINKQIDFDTAAIVGTELGYEVLPEESAKKEEELPDAEQEGTAKDKWIAAEDPKSLKPRPPVVTVLGHVDHGKTTLLDAIRTTNVVAGEAGGITQHIGAYQVMINNRKITFVDTPGHEAFTAMRARGAQVTDLAILVVAADDGVMPQTKEAISHARAARVPILVALNKIDKANANPDRVKQELADNGLVVEDWGGDVICVPISAKQRQGIDTLLENILLVTDVAELKANPNRSSQGTVLEGRLDDRRGVIVSVLVQNGTLHSGDVLVIDEQFARVRAMFDDKGKTIKEAGPSTPVSIMGFSAVPNAGDIFEAVKNEKAAREITSERRSQRGTTKDQRQKAAMTLEDFFSMVGESATKELNIILKADVQGSIEPIIKSLIGLGDENLKVKIIHSGTGNITESDIYLAKSSNAIVVGFNVIVDSAAHNLAEQEGIDIRLYNIIYQLIDDVDKALKGLLEPVKKEVVQGHALVRAIFKITKKGNVAGCIVQDGKIGRNMNVRLLRNGQPIVESKFSSLKRFQEDVREVAAGFECGIALEGYEAYAEGDIIEAYTFEEG